MDSRGAGKTLTCDSRYNTICKAPLGKGVLADLHLSPPQSRGMVGLQAPRDLYLPQQVGGMRPAPSGEGPHGQRPGPASKHPHHHADTGSQGSRPLRCPQKAGL